MRSRTRSGVCFGPNSECETYWTSLIFRPLVTSRLRTLAIFRLMAEEPFLTISRLPVISQTGTVSSQILLTPIMLTVRLE